jgi:hypothetical protein
VIVFITVSLLFSVAATDAGLTTLGATMGFTVLM